ncbi:SDR family NAD(P)-dependent oxidoreductase [Micromonospora sp. WMMD736]|uniref:SDR family NAD(P)-dependent oxidoreductase n=1 Tax=Micromonospora sp. WMMD736 TaxID=3404112 RepID=UPI003B957A84
MTAEPTLVQGAASLISANMSASTQRRPAETRTYDRLTGRTALVVGGARGMGEATARLFHAEGAVVVIGDVLDDLGTAVADDLGDRAVFVHLDVRSDDDWAAAHSVAVSIGDAPVTAYAHPAAIASFSYIADLSPADYEASIAVNQTGVFRGIRSCIPGMTEAGGGAIVTVASVDGVGAHPGLAGYSSAKFALRGLTRVAALELADRGIRVNCIVPGGIDTPMIRPREVDPAVLDPLARQVPLGHVGDAGELARAALWLVSDESSYVTGTDLIVDGGLMARVPLNLG